MAKIYDITDKLTNSKPQIKLGGKTYDVNNGKNTMMKAQSIMKDNKGDIEMIDTVVELLLGSEALEDINKMDLSMGDYNTILTALMASVNEISYEEMERRFQDSK